MHSRADALFIPGVAISFDKFLLTMSKPFCCHVKSANKTETSIFVILFVLFFSVAILSTLIQMFRKGCANTLFIKRKKDLKTINKL